MLQPWVDSLNTDSAMRDVYIDSARGERLHGLYIPATTPTANTAVVIHGWTNNAILMLHIAYLYHHELGYNVVLPELHGHGLNEEGAAQMGWLDRLDVLEWITKANDMFRNDDGDANIVVHGISMGAATTMMTAGEIGHSDNMMPFVKCFVEDCGYTSVRELLDYHIRYDYSLPSFPFIPIANIFCQLRYGWSFEEASAIEAVRRSTRPMLYIHSEGDDFVPTYMVYSLYDANPNPKALWNPGVAAHANSYKDYTEEYTAKVRAFVERFIDDKTAYDI